MGGEIAGRRANVISARAKVRRMTDAKRSTQERLQALDAELDSLERATSPAAAPAPRVKAPRAELSQPENRRRRWLFWIIQCWGALMFLLMLAQDGGKTPPWQWPLLAAFVFGLGWAAYGFHLPFGEGSHRWSVRRDALAA